jgi:hypothetical protein
MKGCFYQTWGIIRPAPAEPFFGSFFTSSIQQKGRYRWPTPPIDGDQGDWVGRDGLIPAARVPRTDRRKTSSPATTTQIVLRSGGQPVQVQAVPVTDDATLARVSVASRQKYRTSPYLPPHLAPGDRADNAPRGTDVHAISSENIGDGPRR